MSIELHIDQHELQTLQLKLRDMTRLDTKPLLHGLAADLESQTRRRIESEKTAASGIPWEALQSTYQEAKTQKSSGGLLEYTGHLLDSIRSDLQGNTVEVGSNLVYAATHQFGDPERNIKARPYLGVSERNEVEMRETMRDWLMMVVDL